MKNNSVVSLIHDQTVKGYPPDPPYSPPQKYPETPDNFDVSPENRVYDMVRELLRQLDLDTEHYGSSEWNPLGQFIQPGNTVVVKPNLVSSNHRLGEEGIIGITTHGAVLRPIVDYVYKALQGKGEIIICDTPMEGADFDKISQITGLKELVAYLKIKEYPIELIDLRKYVTIFFMGGKTKRYNQNGDPNGYKIVDLRNQSEFHELDKRAQNYHTLADRTVDHYDPFCKDIGIPNKHHYPGKHEYLISGTILNADVVISVPKLKTHGKAGVTLSLKNTVGIVSGKDYMPHHRPGNSPCGDAFSTPPPREFIKHRFLRREIARSIYWLQYLIGEQTMKRIAYFGRKWILERFWPVKSEKKYIEWGDWHGNDTLWRTILDLNKILMYCDKNGILKDTPQRKYFSLIDGIIGQEGQGPTMGKPKHTSLLIGGSDPVAVDTISAMMMGFDPKKIKTIVKTRCLEKYFLGSCDIAKIKIACNVDLEKIYQNKFKTPNGWEGYIEK